MTRVVFIFFFLFSIGSYAQNQFSVSGQMVDPKTKKAIPYATAILKSLEDDQIIAGTTTDEAGNFTLQSGSNKVYLEVKFVGYQTQIISLKFDQESAHLGVIEMTLDDEALGGLEIKGEKSTMEFKLDKRVFNVGQDISSSGMGAMDVLNSVPSVNVDIEGNLSLRGNSGVQILIDGKPSVMADDLSSALGSISADMIDKIEVITNPSAKYNAEGTSGIINIILKKDEKKGVNGSISINTGWPHNHSIGASVNLRTTKFNFFTQFGAGYRSLPRYSESLNDNFTDTTRVESEGISYRDENFYNITLGTDYYLNKWNTLTLSGNFAYEIESQPSTTEFWLYNSNNELSSHYRRIEETSALNPKWQYNLNYVKQFKNHKDHKLLFSTQGRFFGKDQNSVFRNELISGLDASDDQKTATNFYQADYSVKLDYVNPLNENWTIEAGGMYDINDVGNDFSVYDLNAGTWDLDSSLTNNFIFEQKVLGVYSTVSYETKKWGLKLGLRVENTDLKTELENTNEKNDRNYTNLFPSIHSSYKVNDHVSMQVGYSRRIFRPRLWDLNPFFNIRNSFNIRTGNPNLQPEFGDSYELTAIYSKKKLNLNGSLYYLHTDEVIERVSRFENNVNITQPINVGTRDKVGIELNFDYDLGKKIGINGDFNYGYFSRTGEYEGVSFDFTGGQWTSKATAKIKVSKEFDFELTGNYQSSVKTVQGSTSGFLFGDIGFRQKLWKGKGVINFSVRDIFASRIRENIVDQDNFYLYSFGRRGRFMTLGFSYSFGKGEAMTYSGGRRRR